MMRMHAIMKFFWVSVVVGLLALGMGNSGQGQVAGPFQVQINCVQQICEDLDKGALENLFTTQLSHILVARQNLDKFINQVESGQVKLPPGSFGEKIYKNRDTIKQIWDKALSWKKFVLQCPTPELAATFLISCAGGTLAFVLNPPSNIIYLCLENFCAFPNRAHILLHELMHTGGARDKEGAPDDAEFLAEAVDYLLYWKGVVPTLTEWGLIALGLLLAGSLAWMIRRRVIARPAGAT